MTMRTDAIIKTLHRPYSPKRSDALSRHFNAVTKNQSKHSGSSNLRTMATELHEIATAAAEKCLARITRREGGKAFYA